MSKPRIICLHGKAQTAQSFSKKIGGARRKLERAFDLTFLDGPIYLEEQQQQQTSTLSSSSENTTAPEVMNSGRAWFLREERLENSSNNSDDAAPTTYRYTKLFEAIEYVSAYDKRYGPYDAIIGFSQGGTLATALATSGAVSVRAVLTAGSPHVEEAFVAASDWVLGIGGNDNNVVSNTNVVDAGLRIPKLHLAGETDAMIPTDSTASLTERGGNGELVIHEKKHLFPTRAIHVDRMVEFLKSSLEQ